MKEKELRAVARCGMCHRLVGHSGLPLFYRVTVARYGIDAHAVRRQDGLAAMLGSSALAQVMGTDADMTTTLMEPATITVCEPCSMEDTLVARLAEVADEAREMTLNEKGA